MLKVLLADNEYIENEALQFIINRKVKNAIIVGTADSGDEVLKLNVELEPDIIFINVVLPMIDGLEVAEIIKRECKDKRIVMISDCDKFELVQKALRIKVDDYLLKPIRPEIIIEILNNFITMNENDEMEENISTLIESIQACDHKKLKQSLMVITDSFEKHNIMEIKKNIAKLMHEVVNGIKKEGFTTMVYNEINLDFCITSQEVKIWLIKEMERLFYSVPCKEDGSFATDSLKSALYYIENNFRNNIMLQDVANEMKFSSTYLCKRFKKDLGTNFNKYLTHRRVDEAKNLLANTSTSINDIAFDIGYNEPNYFCKVFKKNEGITPSEYREKCKKMATV